MSEEHEAPESEPERPSAPRLPYSHIGNVAKLPEGERWLVDGFLAGSSITVLASTPKAGKTWVALGIAVGVASGAPALGRFHVPAPGPVLLFHAEDDSRAVRERIESIALGQGLTFEDLPIHVITATSLKIDSEEDRASLEELLEHLHPKLLVLDPLVRLHSGAESYVGHMAELFGYLRELQRRFGVAILLTHHVAKNRSGGGSAQPGQAMRGSGDIHAAYDHGATLVRQADGSVILTLEHRSAPSPDPIAFRIVSRPGGSTSFDVVDLAAASEDEDRPAPRRVATAPRPRPELSIHEQVLGLLERAGSPLSQVSIRKTLQVRNETLTAVLRDLEAKGTIQNLGRMQGWCLAPGDAAAASSA